MSRRTSTTDDASYAPYLTILADLYAGTSTPQKAALALSSLSLSGSPSDLSASLYRIWNAVIVAARQKPEEQEKLVDLLVSLSLLPDAKDKKGEPILLYDMKVWRDLPMLGWDFNYEWNGFSVPPTPGPERERIIREFIHINAFTAHLMSTHHSAFPSLSLFALWTMRPALETPAVHALPHSPPEASVPAAAAWIDILGTEMYEWDEEFAYGPLIGDGGRGGPLWEGEGEGVHGFCKERWGLWRRRFGEIAGGGVVDVDEGVREVAREAEERMGEIEEAAGGVHAVEGV